MNEKEILNALKEKLKTFDRDGAEALCAKLVDHIYEDKDSYDKKTASSIMNELRHKRMFALMQKVGEAYMLTGKASWKIRKLYAQSLIDQNMLAAAKAVVNELIAETTVLMHEEDACAECMEARGLLGRIYKQAYVNKPHANTFYATYFLHEAIKAYYNVYKEDKKKFTWQGINAAALLVRARKDGIVIEGYPDPVELAAAILDHIDNEKIDGKADTWDFATAAEACIILNQPKDALEWISGYTGSPYADAFELTSTLRQLREVWQMDLESEAGKLILPVLHAVLMTREGGVVRPDAGEAKQLEKNLESTYEDLVDPDTNNNAKGHLEKVFGADTFSSVRSYKDGLNRCYLVGRISKKNGTFGIGTGFILPGNLLHQKFGNDLVLVTNAHVIDTHTNDGAMLPANAEVAFDELSATQRFLLDKVLWSSPYKQLDASVVSFNAQSLASLQQLVDTIPSYPIAAQIPMPDEKNPPLVYIIGYPGGGFMQFSLKNSVLIDCQDPRIHYRSPTMLGSSGSPAFNEDWELVGLHRAGSRIMPKLNGKQGTYEANEGIWIDAIRAAI